MANWYTASQGRDAEIWARTLGLIFVKGVLTNASAVGRLFRLR